MKSTNLLMIIAIVAVSLAAINLMITINKVGDIQALTGYATATANISVLGSANIVFNVSNVNWGTGYVNDTAPFALLDTQGTNTNGTSFTTVNQGLTLQNNGNADVSVNLSSDNADAATFVGGTTDALFQWIVTNNETGACTYDTNITGWQSANTTTTLACWNLSNTDTNDLLQIDLKVQIPDDSAATAKGVIITASGTAI